MSGDAVRRDAARDKLSAVIGLAEEVRAEFEALAAEPQAENAAPAIATQTAAPVYKIRIKNLTIQVPSTLRLETLMTTVIDHLKAINGSVDDMAAIARKIADEYIGTVAALTDQLEAAVAAGAITPELIAEAEKATNKVAALKLQLVALDDLKPDPVPAPNPVL